ncbi:MAG: zf-TFIIB domain-containing protein [Kiritimatiellia bacterium]|jgi:Zn-finger nucleic acid-binding protein
MKCPLCKKRALNVVALAPDLEGRQCGECNGIWIARAKYDAWRKRLPGELPETEPDAEFVVNDTRGAKICPQCGRLLLPYRVGRGLAFSIDYCGACGGVWLDHNEWDAIKARNLHDNLHNIVSANWQSALRRADVEAAIEQTYRRILGDDYGKAAEIRDWLRNHPRQSALLAYLNDVQKAEQGS